MQHYHARYDAGNTAFAGAVGVFQSSLHFNVVHALAHTSWHCMCESQEGKVKNGFYMTPPYVMVVGPKCSSTQRGFAKVQLWCTFLVDNSLCMLTFIRHIQRMMCPSALSNPGVY